MAEYLNPKNIKLFTDMGVYTQIEMESHYDIKLEKYCQVLNIEVETMLEMINKDILPAVFKYMNAISDTVIKVKQAFPEAECSAEKVLLQKLDSHVNNLSKKADEIWIKHNEANKLTNIMECAKAYANDILPAMEEARYFADEMEPLLGEEYKPFPSYEDLLFRI